MVDFASLLSQRVDDAKPPQPLPPGTYEGVIANYKFAESKEKKTPMLAVTVKFLAPREDVDQEAFAAAEIDLTKIERTYNFMLSDPMRWRLAEFIKSCGIPSVGRSFNETVPEINGQGVLIKVTQRFDSQDPTKVYWDIAELTGTHGQDH